MTDNSGTRGEPEALDEALVRHTHRSLGACIKGSLAAILLAFIGRVESDDVVHWIAWVGALLILWYLWTTRITVDRRGVTVQNGWLPRSYPWADIAAVTMLTPRRATAPVVHLRLRDGRCVAVWAGNEAFGVHYVGRLKADLQRAKAARIRLRADPR